jgi:glycosyltransferase involved in cell wall biosynthesis
MSEVTVCITTIGRPHFLRNALQSVQNQIGRNSIAEVVVSENKGDRGSEAVTREFPDLPIRYLFRDPQLPMLAHLFSTFREARTPYLAILNDDDWWCSNHLADGLSALDANSDAAAFSSASLFVTDERSKNPRWIDRSDAVWLVAGKPSWVVPWMLDVRAMLALCWIYTPFHWSSLITRAEHLRGVMDQLENETYHTHTIDRLVFAHLCLRGTFCYNPVPDTFVRWHPANWLKSQPEEEIHRAVRSTVTVVERMAKDHGCNPGDVWKSALSTMPPEAEREVLDRLHQAFTDDELKRLGLAGFFRARLPNGRITALRNIASNTKKLLFGSR